MSVVSIASRRPGRGGARSGAGRKPGSATKNPGRFVYVLHEVDEQDVCKIGIANNPYTRLSGHQVSNWRPLCLAAVFTAESAQEAAMVERAVHKILTGVHESGEWFRVSPERAAKEVMSAGDRLGLAIREFAASDLKTIKPNQDDGQ